MVIFGVRLVCTRKNLKCSIIGCGLYPPSLPMTRRSTARGCGHAAVFAVRDRLQSGRFLFGDHAGDLAVFDRLEGFGVDFVARAFLPRRLERARAQQTADMIGAKRRDRALGHGYPLHVMAAHGRSKNGVASLAYVPAMTMIPAHVTRLSEITGTRRRRASPVLTNVSRPSSQPSRRTRGEETTARLPRQSPRSSAIWPIAHPRRGCCLPRSRRSRIAATSIIDRARCILSRRRSGA